MYLQSSFKLEFVSETRDSQEEVAKCDFDPRHPSDRSPLHTDDLRSRVKGLLDAFPGSGLGHAWGLSSKPPCAAM